MEFQGAHRTFGIPISLVHVEMLVQVGLLGESLVAARLCAEEWALTGVDAEMVKEVVPLSEMHIAVRVVTFQYLDITLSSRIFVSVYTELFGGWNMLVNLD